MFAVASAALLAACVTPSVQTPDPAEPGEVNVGVHASTFVGAGSEAEETGLATAWPTATVNAGVAPQWELGLTAGFTGLYAHTKYGFFPTEEKFQTSVIGGIGYWGPFVLAGGFAVPSVDVGALAGYEVGEVVSVYGGYRHYLTGLLADDELNPVVSVGNVIGGAELFPGGTISVPVEVNYNWVWLSGSLFDRAIEAGSSAVPVVNAGINFSL